MNENAQKFSNAVGQRMVNLAERWQDEAKYENIKDYQKVLQTEADKFGITLTGMIKRPFGCTFTLDNLNYTLQVKLKRNSAKVELFYMKG
jgi:hypothetical protein